MQVSSILQGLLENSIHQTRIDSLSVLVKGVIHCKELKLSSLGRALEINGKECAGINRVDRALSNPYYKTHAIEVYHCIAQKIIGKQKAPLLIVDWSSIPGSHLGPHGEHCMLRASYAAESRAITIYEEVHPKTKEGNVKTHKQFLANLKSILSDECKPCIITDAGFKNPWFKTVLALDWNYIGRLNSHVHFDNGSGFQPLSTLIEQANAKPQALGEATVAKTNPLTTSLYLYKRVPKKRKHLTKTGRINSSKYSRKHAKSNSEAWILGSSLCGKNIEELIIKYYKMRMSIEEGFRDTKSQRYGLSMNDNITIDPTRYCVWLLLGALAHVTAWIVGFAAEQLNLHYDFQANTYRHRRVLSFFFLGCQIIRKNINIPIQLDFLLQDIWEGAS